MKTPLTKEEKSRIPFVKALIRKSGDKYISARKICRMIDKHKPLSKASMTGERLRKMLHYARINEPNKNKVIIASSFGYKYTRDKAEIKRYAISLSERAEQIVRLAKAVSKAV